MSEAQKQALIQSIQARLDRIEADLAEYRHPTVYRSTMHMNKLGSRRSSRQARTAAATA